MVCKQTMLMCTAAETDTGLKLFYLVVQFVKLCICESVYASVCPQMEGMCILSMTGENDSDTVNRVIL